MKALSFTFTIHQPFRLKRYRFFDIGNDHYYYDDFQNDDIMTRMAQRSYIPACETLLRMIEQSSGKFCFALAISGDAVEQIEIYAPELLDLLKKLAATGKVEFLAEPYAHSLASLIDPVEFKEQVKVHSEMIKSRFGVTPTVMRNTELIYSDEIAVQVYEMGYKGCMTEGAKHILGWKSPNYVYEAASVPKLKLLLKNDEFSSMIAFRFSDYNWSEYPLTADKYIDWIAATPEDQQIINVGMNMEVLGDLQPAQSGIFQFMEALPRFAAEKGVEFVTPSEAIKRFKPAGTLAVGHPISWADEARDVSAWLGNQLQNEAFRQLYSKAERVRNCNDRRLKQDWWYLQGSDHFYYMSTKHLGDGEVHSYFSPYSTPFEAFTNYMNVLSDFLARVQEQVPESVGTEELSAIQTAYRNMERENQALRAENESLRRDSEQYNIEHKNREEAKKAAAPKEEAPKAEEAPKKKATRGRKAKKEE